MPSTVIPEDGIGNACDESVANNGANNGVNNGANNGVNNGANNGVNNGANNGVNNGANNGGIVDATTPEPDNGFGCATPSAPVPTAPWPILLGALGVVGIVVRARR